VLCKTKTISVVYRPIVIRLTSLLLFIPVIDNLGLVAVPACKDHTVFRMTSFTCRSLPLESKLSSSEKHQPRRHDGDKHKKQPSRPYTQTKINRETRCLLAIHLLQSHFEKVGRRLKEERKIMSEFEHACLEAVNSLLFSSYSRTI
jgi:hypothetical protein